jgi:hypothetical protein
VTLPWIASPVLVVRIKRILNVCYPTHLPPFAMWSAFPTSDYYGGSVAMGVSPLRRSRISCYAVFSLRKCTIAA